MFRSLMLSAAMAFCLGSAAPAQSTMPLQDEAAQFDILPGWRTEAGTHMAALRVRLAPGWKTYWRAPGEAGIPPRFDWSGSQNIEAVAFHWPTPSVYLQNGMQTIGYSDELVLPMELTPRQAGAPIALRAEVEIGICQDVCIPVQVRVVADLDRGPRPDARIVAAIADVPPSARSVGLKTVRCGVEPIEDGLRLTANIEMPALGRNEIAVFEVSDQSIWVAESSSSREGGMLTATTDLVSPSNRPFMLDRSDVRITVLAAGQAVDIWGCPAG